MKLLIDVNLSPRWVSALAQGGWYAKHWSSGHSGNTADAIIMTFAAETGYVILTNDLDFGTLLAGTNAATPSVIQLRLDDVRPEAASKNVLQVISKIAPQLEIGALVTIQQDRFRVALLPLSQSS